MHTCIYIYLLLRCRAWSCRGASWRTRAAAATAPPSACRPSTSAGPSWLTHEARAYYGLMIHTRPVQSRPSSASAPPRGEATGTLPQPPLPRLLGSIGDGDESSFFVLNSLARELLLFGDKPPAWHYLSFFSRFLRFSSTAGKNVVWPVFTVTARYRNFW